MLEELRHTAQSPFPVDRFLKRPVLQDMTGLKTTTLYDLMRANQFPQPVKLSQRSVAWRESEVLAWMASRPKANLARQVVEDRPDDVPGHDKTLGRLESNLTCQLVKKSG